MYMLWFLIIGVLAGWLAGVLLKGHGFGFLGDLVIGIVGAFIGGFVFRLLGITAYGLMGSLVCATIGAMLLVWLVRFLRRI